MLTVVHWGCETTGTLMAVGEGQPVEVVMVGITVGVSVMVTVAGSYQSDIVGRANIIDELEQKSMFENPYLIPQ